MKQLTLAQQMQQADRAKINAQKVVVRAGLKSLPLQQRYQLGKLLQLCNDYDFIKLSPQQFTTHLVNQAAKQYKLQVVLDWVSLSSSKIKGTFLTSLQKA